LIIYKNRKLPIPANLIDTGTFHFSYVRRVARLSMPVKGTRHASSNQCEINGYGVY